MKKETPAGLAICEQKPVTESRSRRPKRFILNFSIKLR